MNSWHVRCWCGLREIENAGEASPYLDISPKVFQFFANLLAGDVCLADRGFNIAETLACYGAALKIQVTAFTCWQI